MIHTPGMKSFYEGKEVAMNKKVAEFISSLPGGLARKRYAGTGQRGQPDVTGCLGGRRIELEGKVYPNKPTKIQMVWLKRWAKAGALAGWYYDLDDVKEFLKSEGLLE